MTAKSKNCPSTPKKQTRAKPATPPPVPIPVFAKIPCPRDQEAYGLHLEQHTQRWIAGKLKCTQPTVLRGIRRMEKWLATTLPEDRGEYTATEKLRLALAKHERLMERLLKMSLREFRRSRKTIPMKKTITMKEGKDEQGEPVKIRIEEWNKPQIGRKGFIDSAAKTSHEITVLAAGWLGSGSGTISMAEVMDPEERDRWDRMVKIQDARIKELEQRVAAPVSKVAENNAIVYQETVQEVDATAGGEGACVLAPIASAPKIDHPQNLYQAPPRKYPVGHGSPDPARTIDRRSPSRRKRRPSVGRFGGACDPRRTRGDSRRTRGDPRRTERTTNASARAGEGSSVGSRVSAGSARLSLPD